MSHFAIANKINNDVFVESLTVLSGNFESIRDVIHRVCIYMEDWSGDGRGNLRTVCTRPCPIRSSRESDLIVNHDMDGATNSVICKAFHLEAFIDDTLASHSCISMNHNWNDFASIFLLATQEVLLCPTSSLNARVYSLEMRWIREQS